VSKVVSLALDMPSGVESAVSCADKTAHRTEGITGSVTLDRVSCADISAGLYIADTTRHKTATHRNKPVNPLPPSSMMMPRELKWCSFRDFKYLNLEPQ
jgi:hypothetical protein